MLSFHNVHVTYIFSLFQNTSTAYAVFNDYFDEVDFSKLVSLFKKW